MAATEALPDLLILGDSHSTALAEGCAAHGLRAEVLAFSGNLWHGGHIALHRGQGLRVRPAAMQGRLDAVREKARAMDVLRPDLPVLASVGFHLGRLVPPFGVHGHVAQADEFDAADDRLFASSALVMAYVGQFRARQARFLARVARMAPLTAVAPPPFYTLPNYRAIYDEVVRAIRRAGVTLYDPRDDWGGDAPLDPAWLAADGVHGNAAYGATLIGHMIDRGLIRRR